MERREVNFKVIVGIMAGALLGTVILSAALGSTYIEWETVYKIIVNKVVGREFFEPLWERSAEVIVWEIRLPRVILGGMCGGGLAVCGVLMQCITRNSIADPYLLGVSSGASAGAVFVLIAGGGALGITSVMGGAFIGAMACGMIVFILGTSRGSFGSATRLILIGISTTAIFSAITNVIIYSAENSSQVKSALFWSLGSLGRAKWENLSLPLGILIVVVVVVVLMGKSLDILLLGDVDSVILGMDVNLVKITVVVLTTLLTSVLVSLSGGIGFVGLIIPHVCRSIYGSSHRGLTLISLLAGGIFLIWCDVLGRVVFAPRELPIGIITALIGGPFFLWRVCRDRYTFGEVR